MAKLESRLARRLARTHQPEAFRRARLSWPHDRRRAGVL